MSECKIIDINQEIKDFILQIKQNYKMKLPDFIIVATAMFLDFPLITADKDFSKINEINLHLFEF